METKNCLHGTPDVIRGLSAGPRNTSNDPPPPGASIRSSHGQKPCRGDNGSGSDDSSEAGDFRNAVGCGIYGRIEKPAAFTPNPGRPCRIRVKEWRTPDRRKAWRKVTNPPPRTRPAQLRGGVLCPPPDAGVGNPIVHETRHARKARQSDRPGIRFQGKPPSRGIDR